jgi:hypothetical protein
VICGQIPTLKVTERWDYVCFTFSALDLSELSNFSVAKSIILVRP